MASTATDSSCSSPSNTTSPTRSEARPMSTLFSRRRVGLLFVAVLTVTGMLIAVTAQQRPDPQTAVNNAFNQFRTLKEGKNADYIPALAKVDPNLFGIALVTVDGKV